MSTLPPDSLIARLAQHARRPVPADVRTRARLHLLDWLGCVAGARRSWDSTRTAAWPAIEAAALLGNVLEMDDVHRAAILHPGPVVWPAAIGARRCAVTMGTLLTAAVRGYEAMISVGATFDAHHYAFHHNTATAGPFGAAAAAWSLSGGDDPEVLANALGLAGSVTGGLWRMRHEPGEAKQFHILHAIETGTRAATAALRGLRGPRFILEGEQGLWAATCDAPRGERLIGGDDWRIDEVSFKPWGACRHAHPAIDAALQLQAQGELAGGILVETYADALAFCDRPDPRTVTEAKFSLQHAVAIVIERGVPTLADFEPDAIVALAAARQRVSVCAADEFTARYPEHFGARVSGAGEAAAVIDTLGDPERPLDQNGVTAKARALMAWGGVAPAEADAVVAMTLDTPDDAAQPDLAGLLAGWLDPRAAAA